VITAKSGYIFNMVVKITILVLLIMLVAIGTVISYAIAATIILFLIATFSRHISSYIPISSIISLSQTENKVRDSDNIVFNNSLISSYYYYIGEQLERLDHKFTVMATPESAEFIPDIVKKLDELTNDETGISEVYVFKSGVYQISGESNQIDGDVCILFSKSPKLIGMYLYAASFTNMLVVHALLTKKNIEHYFSKNSSGNQTFDKLCNISNKKVTLVDNPEIMSNRISSENFKKV
jgi:hypothetical protein